MGLPVVHFEISAKDRKQSQKFYSELFKWDIKTIDSMNYGLVNTGSKKGIQGGIGQVNPNQAPYVTFYIAVADPQAYLDKAVSLGGKVILPLMEVPNMVTFAQFSDPDGNVIGLVDSAGPAPKKQTARSAKTKKRGRK